MMVANTQGSEKSQVVMKSLQKGGIPATPSGTATLLLQTSGTTIFHGLTGGVYKARERIHRVMADARLLANPTSQSRVADSDPN